ncbi:MAG: GvpL/GvpF family gas vesicle protein [Acidobacteria bacterium]|nr:GvpL/GvpF family gas vesicle protein [Acidobacteriota bacterium]
MSTETRDIARTTTPRPAARLDSGPARYVYGITYGSMHRRYVGLGLDGATVYAIGLGPIAALVSNVATKRFRPERGKLAAHHGVIKRCAGEGAVLPVAFGTIADSDDAVREILEKNREAFLEQLNGVRGKVEMGLRVAWDVPNIFEYFVKHHVELAALRDHVFGKQRGPSHEDKIELGRLFDHLLGEEREAHTEKVEDILSARCAEIKRNPPRNEREVMNLACLVEREALKGFEDGVFAAARLFDNNFAFDFNGPWAPYNFVSVALEL